MVNTKERILRIALDLFSRDGYEAVSVSAIAKELKMTKSALYKHYKSKRDIFDNILARMSQMDIEGAKHYDMPEGTFEEMEEVYNRTPIENIKIYTESQFRHWTEDEFSSNFRKMMTLEQYRNSEMSQLYQQYFVSGPLQYMEDLFNKMSNGTENAKLRALHFYAPVFTLYSLYDGAIDKGQVFALLQKHIAHFTNEMSK
ncbi:TetR/AcrR family transcriptional regulator [Eubacterium barkeri]|uniref:DNA-binding transcriptional regulator, AcrR family n=1 Tax=Eubacterium barkeri TaxID=1528 RepID=A0A1H3FRA4_EUBBA|nr:TetR/AcrR family transcriptional regulator [Eubacterium barkeri]SDX93526.1 DNA-binding transcriptional regulator, AcrR family [Eubacterium barkeri]